MKLLIVSILSLMLFVSILSLMFFTSWGRINRITQEFTGNAQEVCHEGVTYLQFGSGASVAYTPEGKIKTCN